METLTLEERSNATLNCTSPDVSISWTFNGMPAPFSQTLEPCEDGSGNDWMSANDSETCTQYSSYLHLLNFEVCHQGIYKCVGNSSNATDTTYEEYNVTMSQNFSGEFKLLNNFTFRIIYFKWHLNIVNDGARSLPQVRGGRVCTCMLARCRVVIAKLANQNMRLPS